MIEKCKNKRDFDVKHFEDILIDRIESEIEKYDKVVAANETAYIKYREYVKEYNPLHPEYITSDQAWRRFTNRLFFMYEKLLFQRHKLIPNRYTKVLVSKSYSSPQGKVTKNTQHLYSYDGLKSKYDLVKHIIESRTERQNLIKKERAMVTVSLRTSVMKRDNYTCQKCGRTVKDAVMLHVDHIIPISKRGKTELNNLQTLCIDCNLGKGNKI